MPTRDERADATRATLLAVARELFGQRGYAEVGTEEIVERAGVTRGALYHHFDGKRELFRAVHEQLEREILDGIVGLMREANDPVEMLRIGLAAFLDMCTDRRITRISMVDAPTVLGWAAWREIGERHALGMISAALTAGMDAGLLRGQPVRPLALVLLGAVDEAALYIANAEDPDAARAEMEPVLLSLLDGQRGEP
jgi:AcrR family transcriptional regulator